MRGTSRWAGVLLVIITLGSGVLGFLILDRGHSWGDDFAAYIIQAQSLVNGNMEQALRRSAFTIQQSSWRFGPPVVPWGFPLLLAPVVAVIGTKVIGFKLVGTLCYVAFLPVYYLLDRTRINEREALLLTAFMAFNVAMLRAQNEILSDVPFLLWSTLAIWLIEDQRRAGMRQTLLGAACTGLAIFAALLTRPNGVLLLLPLSFAQGIHLWRRPRGTALRGTEIALLVVPYFVLVIALLVQQLVLPASEVGLREQWQTLSWGAVAANFPYYLLLPGDFLNGAASGGYFLYVILLGSALLAIRKRVLQQLPILLYCLSTLALYVAFPFRQGPRYLYPILPLFFLLAMQGMRIAQAALSPRMHRAAEISLPFIWLVPTLSSLVFGIQAARINLAVGRQPAAGPYGPAAADMFSFIRNATPPDSVVIFYKPRAMRLFTDRDAFLTTKCEDLTAADYVVIMKDGGTYDQISPSRIGSCNSNVVLTRKYGKGDFEVFQIDPIQ